MATITAYLGLGSNLGDRMANLERAIELLARAGDLLAVSSVYETEPWGFQQQPAFLNCACGIETQLTPTQLLATTQDVEARVGRQPTFRYGPRVIDIDILLYGQECFSTRELTIPHPRLAQRAFALVPLAEIAPHVEHPVLHETMARLLSQVEGRAGVGYFAPPLVSTRPGRESGRCP